MLHYLRIFSWFLLTFGVVGFGAIAIGVDPGIGTGAGALGVMALQVAIAVAILWGFRLNRSGKLHREVLVVGGWLLVLLLVVVGSIWMNVGEDPGEGSSRVQGAS